MKEWNAWPEPEVVQKVMRIQASLNMILCQEEWLRYHSFVPKWGENISLAKIDNGSGDHLLILFSPQGTIIKGFDHESAISPYAQDEHAVWPGIYDDVPHELLSLLGDEALEKEDVTFCIWRGKNDTAWKRGNIFIPEGETDGSAFLLGTLFFTPAEFVDFADDYFEITLSSEIVEKIYEGLPITKEMIRVLNAECDPETVLRELETIQA